MTTTTSFSQLNAQLEEARQAYYAGRIPTMTDGEYDTNEALLAGLVKQNPEQAALATVLTTVGTDTGGRIPHEHPMKSIDNIYSEEDLIAWVLRVISLANSPDWPNMTLGSKWDGVSCSLTYQEGDLVKAVTRGDGEAGESILPQVLATHMIPSHLHFKLNFEVRGELVIRSSTMALLNVEQEAMGKKPYVSTRNLVAGTLKLQNLQEVTRRNMQFCPWEVFCPMYGLPYDSALLRLQDIVQYGFSPSDDRKVSSPEELHTALTEMLAELKMPGQEIGRDGLVLKVDSFKLREQLGCGSKFANFQVAFKAQNSQAVSVLKEVIWQVGRQGRLTPVGIIEPVVLAGATIERVTLNNLSWIRDMKLKKGCRVLVRRSGEVIPQIVEVVDE